MEETKVCKEKHPSTYTINLGSRLAKHLERKSKNHGLSPENYIWQILCDDFNKTYDFTFDDAIIEVIQKRSRSMGLTPAQYIQNLVTKDIESLQ